MHGTNRSPIGALFEHAFGRVLGDNGRLRNQRRSRSGRRRKKFPCRARDRRFKTESKRPHPTARIAPLPAEAAPPAGGARACRSYAAGQCRPARQQFSKAARTFKPLARPASGPFASPRPPRPPAADVAAVKRVIEAARKGKEADADAAEASITDPVAQQARRMGDPALGQHQSDFPALCRLRRSQSELAARPVVPPARRKCALERWRRRPHRARLLRQASAVDRQRPLHAGARLARARRPRRRGGFGAPRLAQRRMQRRGRKARARDVRQHAHHRRPQGAHGAPLLCRRRRRRHARRRTSRRQRGRDRARRAQRSCARPAMRRPRSMRCRHPRKAIPATFSRACNGCARTTTRKKPAN